MSLVAFLCKSFINQSRNIVSEIYLFPLNFLSFVNKFFSIVFLSFSYDIIFWAIFVVFLLQTILADVQKQGDKYGFQAKPWEQWKRRKIIVEFR